MTRHFSKLGGVIALVLAGVVAPVSASADENEFVVSQDARFFHGQLVRADLVPSGIHTITYAQYVVKQRSAGLTPRTLNQMRSVVVAGTIGVFR